MQNQGILVEGKVGFGREWKIYIYLPQSTWDWEKKSAGMELKPWSIDVIIIIGLNDEIYWAELKQRL